MGTICLAVTGLIWLAGLPMVSPAPAHADGLDFTVSGAQYDWDDNTLTLNFTGRLNIFNMDVSQISITDGVCALAFTWNEYGAASRDRHSITFEPNDIQRESLAGMTEPHIQFRNGSFHEFGTDAMMVPVEMPLDMTGNPPHHDPKCVITYGYNEALLSSYAYDDNQTARAVHDGFSAWSDLNPYFEFVWTDTDPLVWVEWVDYHSEYVGLACIWCLNQDPSMDIILYGYDCGGGRIHRTPDAVRDTVAHELGHILGLGHHTNKTHLMYGPEYQVDPYETYGYAVPDQLEEWTYVGEAELNEQILVLEDELDGLDAEITKLQSRGDRVGNTIYFDTQSQANRYNWLIGEYNRVVGEYNALAEELNCMYEGDDPWH
jgi:hypothetical protein